ncbi:MAG: FAD-dependent oxidoreductase, partial [Candidatus Hodarchaeales archaeon]
MTKNEMNPIESRNKTIKRMNAEEFDVVIIGGGINGAGIARDAILRGFSVALIEKNDIGYGTSSGSSKIVHAGLRYLAQKEFRLVREASIERKKILEMAPHITRPLEFLLPLYSDLNTSKSRIRLGVWLYDLLATFRNYTFHKIRNSEIGRNFLPNPIREENFQGIASYGDGQ